MIGPVLAETPWVSSRMRLWLSIVPPRIKASSAANRNHPDTVWCASTRSGSEKTVAELLFRAVSFPTAGSCWIRPTALTSLASRYVSWSSARAIELLMSVGLLTETRKPNSRCFGVCLRYPFARYMPSRGCRRFSWFSVISKARAEFLSERHEISAEQHDTSSAIADIHILGSERMPLSFVSIFDDITASGRPGLW